MNNRQEGRTVADRRSFLKLAGAGAVASGAALITGGAPAAAKDGGQDKGALYEETAHVKTYYDLARF